MKAVCCATLAFLFLTASAQAGANDCQQGQDALAKKGV